MPDSVEDPRYADKAYWTERYREPSPFEWYFSFEALKPLVKSRVVRTRNDSVLDVGCGTSRFLSDLRRDGHAGWLVGLDFAPIDVVGDVDFVCADATALPYDDETFDAVLDKGTVDAMICGGPDSVTRACASVARVLRPGGRYCVCSQHHLDDDLTNDPWLAPMLAGLDQRRWVLDVHTLGQDAPTVYIFTKRRLSPRATHADFRIAVHNYAGGA